MKKIDWASEEIEQELEDIAEFVVGQEVYAPLDRDKRVGRIEFISCNNILVRYSSVYNDVRWHYLYNLARINSAK